MPTIGWLQVTDAEALNPLGRLATLGANLKMLELANNGTFNSVAAGTPEYVIVHVVLIAVVFAIWNPPEINPRTFRGTWARLTVLVWIPLFIAL